MLTSLVLTSRFADKLELRKDAVSKKKRKSRTAFTNHQIFELEKRFLHQKYLSPPATPPAPLLPGLPQLPHPLPLPLLHLLQYPFHHPHLQHLHKLGDTPLPRYVVISNTPHTS